MKIKLFLVLLILQFSYLLSQELLKLDLIRNFDKINLKWKIYL